MLLQGSTLIVDDKIEDGVPVSTHLSSMCVPHLFFHADDEKILDAKKRNQDYLNKVRVVFQDLSLIGSGSPSAADYAKAAEVLELLLSPSNGPWLMVTWSTWSSDENEKYAKELFDYLRAELKSSNSPYDYVILDKAKFNGGADHASVIDYSKMTGEMKADFTARIDESVKSEPSMNLLMKWERNVEQAVSSTISDLNSLAVAESHDKSIGHLIFNLAGAEAGLSLTNENVISSLVRNLNEQIQDKTQRIDNHGYDVNEYSEIEVSNIDEWKRRVNKILHVDNDCKNFGPGAMYSFNSFLKTISSCHGFSAERKIEDAPVFNELYITEHFNSLVNKSESVGFKEAAITMIKGAESITVDVTAPCDYAQNKFKVIKLIGGVLVDIPTLGAKPKKEFEKVLISPDYIWASCEFSLETSSGSVERKRILLDSRLMFTIPDHDGVFEKLEFSSISKIRQQIMYDMTHWLGKQLTRPGYTYM